MGLAVAEKPAGPKIALSVREAALATILLVCLSLLWLFNLFIFASNDVQVREIPIIVIYCLAIFAIEALVLILLRRFGALVFIVLATLNTYSLYVVFEAQTAFGLGLLLILLLSAAALYFVALQVVLAAGTARRWLLGALVLGVIGVGAIGVLPLIRTPAEAGTVPGTQPVQAVADVRILDFTRKPNIYFLGFDAMMPQVLAQKLLGIERPAYVDVIEKHGGRVIPNLFADQVPTKWFWGRAMNILPLAESNPSESLLGFRPSALSETLRHNGYTTHFTYHNAYFGEARGPFLTSYAFNEAYSTCSFVDGPAKRFGFLGYCALQEAGWLDFSRDTSRQGMEEFYLQRLRMVTREAGAGPHFFAAHYPRPNHTPPGYQIAEADLEKYKKGYAARSHRAAEMMEEMLREIESRDPTAIVLVFGDHGPLTQLRRPYAEDPELIVPDRHGIMGAVFGADECMPVLMPEEGVKYRTFAQVVAGLLQCLGGGTSPLMTDFDFNEIRSSSGLRFEDFVYE